MFSLALACLLGATNLSGQNLLLNPSFESGVIAPWTASGVISDDAQHGMYAANGNIEQIVALEAGKKYTWTAQVKCLGGCDLNMWIGVRDLVDMNVPVTNYNFATFSEYGEAKIEFTAASSGNHRFFVWGVNGTSYISDNHLLLLEGTTSTKNIANSYIDINNQLDAVTVNFKQLANEAMINIFDLTGKPVYQVATTDATTRIDNTAFGAAGFYVVHVKTDKYQISKKVAILNN